ncbi:AAA family ATPase [Candidatus Micrarchaeota archaeon]|nr:AAA family ATPase [Candidatus Micrarchaeota archaeon]
MRIIITGSPGTGKSIIAKKLAKLLDLELIDIKKIVKKKGISTEVDIKKLASALKFLKKKNNYIVEGHLACETKLPADYIFVLRTHPNILKKRLKKRKYGKKKLEENLMAEMLDYCTQRVEQVYGKKPLELDTANKTPEKSVLEIKNAIKQKKKKLDSVNYSKELKNYLKLKNE